MGFSADVKSFTEKYRKRMAYTAKKATLDVCNDARLVGPSVSHPEGGKGGRMPIDTGNLRASMVASTEGIPSGPTEGNKSKSGDNVEATILKWKPGQTLFYAGFPPKYARAMEYKYGYMRGAVMKWGDFVRKAATESLRVFP